MFYIFELLGTLLHTGKEIPIQEVERHMKRRNNLKYPLLNGEEGSTTTHVGWCTRAF